MALAKLSPETSWNILELSGIQMDEVGDVGGLIHRDVKPLETWVRMIGVSGFWHRFLVGGIERCLMLCLAVPLSEHMSKMYIQLYTYVP